MKDFFFFEVDNFLPQDLYERARDAFPDPETFNFDTSKEGNKLLISSAEHPERVQWIRYYRPVWDEVCKRFENKEFLAALREKLNPHLPKGRKIGTNPRIEFEFSRLENGAFVPAHTDAENKIASLLLYFPEIHWTYGGATVYYTHKEGKENWNNYRVPLKDLEPLHTNEFIDNKLIVFLKSATSYHAVPTITCPEGISRNTLNINIMKEPSLLTRWGKTLKS